MATRERAVGCDGVVLLDKPAGLTSNQALQRVKRAFAADKAGHTGALDPLATGMLPICLGEATKASTYLLASRKRYRVVANLGVATDTADAAGLLIQEAAVPPLTAALLEQTAARFRGPVSQLPPMYSAVHHQGQRLYALARRGETVERQLRQIRIDELSILGWTERTIEFDVLCSKGTYIRSLVEDFAVALGTVAHVGRLHRLVVEPFGDLPMISLDRLSEIPAAQLRADWLLPLEQALLGLPEVHLDAEQARRLCCGQRLGGLGEDSETGPVRAYDPERRLLGIAERSADGSLRPQRMLSTVRAV